MPGDSWENKETVWLCVANLFASPRIVQTPAHGAGDAAPPRNNKRRFIILTTTTHGFSLLLAASLQHDIPLLYNTPPVSITFKCWFDEIDRASMRVLEGDSVVRELGVFIFYDRAWEWHVPVPVSINRRTSLMRLLNITMLQGSSVVVHAGVIIFRR